MTEYYFLFKNYKRVAEVWMDEYKEYLYQRDPYKYESIDAGDLTKQKAIREKLQCKPFKWFMEEIAFDLPKKYPPIEPPDFAWGTVRSLNNPQYCADSLNNGNNKPVGLYNCASNHIRPQLNQFFVLSWHKDIRVHGSTKCWDVSSSYKNAPVLFFDCHGQQGNQLWRYNSVCIVYSNIRNERKQCSTAHTNYLIFVLEQKLDNSWKK